MHQLSGLDAAFLALDSPRVYGHVGSVTVLDPEEGQELTLERVTRLVESRLPLIPPFYRKLVTVPFGLDQPYWIDDPDFDIEFHVRELALPAPGDDRQLALQAARLHARPLDRSRPLWEMYLIHGLSGGRLAVYSKVHHAAIDGVSGNDVMAALLDTSPEGSNRSDEPPSRSPRRPTTVQMLGRGVVDLAVQPFRAVRVAGGVARALPALATGPARPKLPVIDRLVPRRKSSAILSAPPLRAPATPFNKNIGPHRRWAFSSLDLEQVKELKNAAGTSVNDVVMALCAGALQTWLVEHQALPEGPLIAAVPVSVRSEDQKGTLGNRVSAVMSALPTNIADPVERLQATHEQMRVAKEQHDALPASLLADVSEFAMPAVANQASRLAARLRLLERVNPFNLIISNVPGPNMQFYLAGLRVEAVFPLSAIADGQGLNITVLGIGGKLNFGVIADRDLIPDVDRITDAIQDELQILREALGLG